MDHVTVLPLNQGQQAAADGFFKFLFTPEKELILSGPGGVGKTFLMGYLIDRIMPRYFETCQLMGQKPAFDEVVMTATTNKAAEVLALATNRPTSTIHSFLNLRVKDNYTTGKSELTKTGAWEVHERKIIFVDESSMIDTPLRRALLEGTHDCKIVYVGDHCQLAPVMETISPIYNTNLPFFELTEPMRNSGQPALINLCKQLRHTVETGEFLPIQIVPGVIDHLNDAEMQQAIDTTFLHQTRDSRILAYTNKRVVQYNDHIRLLRQLPDQACKGELLVNTSAIQLRNGMLTVEDEVEILSADRTELVEIVPDLDPLEVQMVTLRTSLNVIHTRVPLPANKPYFDQLLAYFKKHKRWERYFYLKNTFPDLRQRDAATIHKAQGSTYQSVFVDVGNISTCHQPDVVARMLYVAFTRPQQRIFLYGNLAKKYGGLID